MHISTESCPAAGHLQLDLSDQLRRCWARCVSDKYCTNVLLFFQLHIGEQNDSKFVNSAEFENFINKWAMNLNFIATDYQARLRVARDRMDDENDETIEWWAVE